MRELNDFFMRPANILNEREQKEPFESVKMPIAAGVLEIPLMLMSLKSQAKAEEEKGTNNRISPELCLHCLSVGLR